ncbi:hypothetical protein DPV78_001637 [Talaromyces pinophilus]|nr:hypothetical protein DPV78_001637 [Talaromyces pinophilus]
MQIPESALLRYAADDLIRNGVADCLAIDASSIVLEIKYQFRGVISLNSDSAIPMEDVVAFHDLVQPSRSLKDVAILELLSHCAITSAHESFPHLFMKNEEAWYDSRLLMSLPMSDQIQTRHPLRTIPKIRHADIELQAPKYGIY